VVQAWDQPAPEAQRRLPVRDATLWSNLTAGSTDEHHQM